MAANNRFDVVVLGAGPAGYVAAIRCAQLGLKTACVDDWLDPDGVHRLGGTCLNVGCIPSKALLESSEHYATLKQGISAHGIIINGVELDLPAMMQRKHTIIDKLTSGISTLFKSNGVKLIQGRGRLLSNRLIEVTSLSSTPSVTKIESDQIIIATGSRPLDIPVAPINHDTIVDSTGALAFSEVPKRLGIIGAGVIGLELGSIWQRLGSKVILLEAQQEFLPFTDKVISKAALNHFGQQGLEIRLGARVTASHVGKQQITVTYQDSEGDRRLVVDKLLVAVGRVPNSAHLTAPDLHLLLDEGGFIHVDDSCRTSLPGVYAIGDVIRGPMLAHKGSEEGMAVAETIAGKGGSPDLNLIPFVIYTHPEIAWVGKSEESLAAAGIPHRIGLFPFAANGRAIAMDNIGGMVKILSHADSDRILGVHIIGPMASELLATAVVAMEFEASSEDLARTIFAHPTLSEAIHEAALAVDGRAVHSINRKPSKSGAL